MLVWPGSPVLGATWDGAGTNFGLFSEVAERVELCLFDEDGTETRVELMEVDGFIWHAYLPGISPGQHYGYRVHGPWDAGRGLLCSPAKLLLDPYAQTIEGQVTWSPAVFAYQLSRPGRRDNADSAPYVPRSVVVNPYFDWGNDRRLRQPWPQSVLYEVHVAGLTRRHPGIPEPIRGTYAAVAHPVMIEHYQRLGVTAVVLMPVQHFLDSAALVEVGLSEYWGYSTIGYFAPERRYASVPGHQVREFKAMVLSLHQAGMEVILDIDFSATAEFAPGSPMFCFRGIDAAAYYLGDDADPAGLNVRHPSVTRLVMDALRYWATDMNVDGFRLASMPAIAASASSIDGLHALFTIMRQDPVLGQVKLLADGWDAGSGGYQVDNFPPLWAEQNRGFYEWTRNLWRPGIIEFRTSHLRMTGSPDRYDPLGPLDRPTSPANYIASHNGFTLADLVAYNDKHNEANGQGNTDGPDNERSWNSGVEGPTDDALINRLRSQRIRGLLATLFLAQGTPLLQAGDDLGRTQAGNNNAWCQDNELTWLDWENADHVLIGYVAALIRLRQAHPLLGHGATRSALGAPALTVPDSACLDQHGKRVSGAAAASSAFQLFFNGRPMTADQWDVGQPVDNDLLILVNAGGLDDEFTLPPGEYALSWEVTFDTSDVPRTAGVTLLPTQSVAMQAHSMTVLMSQRDEERNHG